MANVSLHPAAAADYDDAHDWYGARDRAVADQFEAGFQEAFRTLAALPEIGAPCDRHHRIWPVANFPYGLVYRLVAGDVLVVAVKHDRQRPGYWKKRT